MRLGRGDVIVARLEDQGEIWIGVTRDGTALEVTAGPGLLLEDPKGVHLKTTEYTVVPRADGAR